MVFSVAKGPFYEDFYQCVTHGFYTERWQEQAYTTMSLIFMFILPLIILVSTYVSTIRTIASEYFCILQGCCPQSVLLECCKRKETNQDLSPLWFNRQILIDSVNAF